MNGSTYPTPSSRMAGVVPNTAVGVASGREVSRGGQGHHAGRPPGESPGCRGGGIPTPKLNRFFIVSPRGMGRPAVGVDNDSECIPVAEARVKAVNRGLF